MQTQIVPSKPAFSAAEVRLTSPQDVTERWPFVADLVARLVDGCNVPSVATVYERLLYAAAQLWIIWDNERIAGVCVTRFAPTDEGRVLDIWFVAGSKIGTWIHLIADIEAWAREQKCIRIRSELRPGLESPLKQLGYTTTHVVVQKSL